MKQWISYKVSHVTLNYSSWQEAPDLGNRYSKVGFETDSGRSNTSDCWNSIREILNACKAVDSLAVFGDSHGSVASVASKPGLSPKWLMSIFQVGEIEHCVAQCLTTAS